MLRLCYSPTDITIVWKNSGIPVQITDDVSIPQRRAELTKHEQGIHGSESFGRYTLSNLAYDRLDGSNRLKFLHPLVATLRIEIITHASLGSSEFLSRGLLGKVVSTHEFFCYQGPESGQDVTNDEFARWSQLLHPRV